MSKTIKTIQSSDKQEFDNLVNKHLEQGWKRKWNDKRSERILTNHH
jgi:hypothetical protein